MESVHTLILQALPVSGQVYTALLLMSLASGRADGYKFRQCGYFLLLSLTIRVDICEGTPVDTGGVPSDRILTARFLGTKTTLPYNPTVFTIHSTRSVFLTFVVLGQGCRTYGTHVQNDMVNS